MPSTLASSPVEKPLLSRRQRLFGSWWKRQSPARQDRFATIGPLISVLLFLAAMVAAFWYLRNEEFEREQESVKRDTEIAQQQIRLRMIENQEQLVRMAREVATQAIDVDEFIGQATDFVRERPEVTSLSWIKADRSTRARYDSPNHPLDPDRRLEPDRPLVEVPRRTRTRPVSRRRRRGRCTTQPRQRTRPHVRRSARTAPAGLLAPLHQRARSGGVPGPCAAARSQRVLGCTGVGGRDRIAAASLRAIGGGAAATRSP